MTNIAMFFLFCFVKSVFVTIYPGQGHPGFSQATGLETVPNY